MVTRFSFENKTMGIINVIVEPGAVNFDLEMGKSLEIELTCEGNEVDHKLEQ